MIDLNLYEADALDETCDLETGTANTQSPTTVSGLSCMFVPPTDEEDDVALNLLISDASTQVEIGCRVIYDSLKYLVKSLQRDGNYVKVSCQEWPERMS
jgi:hypothetical protein